MCKTALMHKPLFMCKTLLVAVMLLPSWVLASSLTFQWELPTKRTDGKTLVATDLSTLELSCQQVQSSAAPVVYKAVPPATTMTVASDVFFKAGNTYDCAARVIDKHGLVSAWSTPPVRVEKLLPPQGPTLLRFTFAN